MPTFFARRYMRDKVSATEVVIGLVILLLAAGIVAALVATVRPGEKRLFESDAKYQRTAAPSRELRVAAEMMPALPAAWKASGAVEARQADALGDWVAEGADAFQSNGLVWAYHGRFETADGGGGSVGITVFDMSSPQNAAAIAKVRQPAAATPGTLGRGGWTAGPRVGFWNGRYYTEIEAAGADAPKAAVDVAKAAAAVQLSYGPSTLAPDAAATTRPAEPSMAKRPEHFPEMPGAGWTSPDAIKRFDQETLYEKIDGKAGMFIAYLFAGLEFATYQKTDKGWPFDVYVYDMSEPLNAFGVYRVERSPEAAVRPLGREGYTSGASVFFWKGKYYVNVMGPPDQPEAAGAAEQIAAAVEKTISDDGKSFWAQTVFPAANQKKGSFSYKSTDALGYSFVRQLFLAEYAVDGKTYQLFIHRAADDAAAKALFAKYAEAVQKYNKVVSRKPSKGGEMLLSESLGVFEAGFYTGALFGGVTECPDAALAEKQATAFCEGLDVAAITAIAPVPVSAPAAVSGSSGSQESGGDGGEQASSEH